MFRDRKKIPSSLYLRAHLKTAVLSAVLTQRDRAQCRERKSDKLAEFAKGYGAKGLAYIAIHEDGSWKIFLLQIYDRGAGWKPPSKPMDGQAGDLFAADRNKIVWNVLGALRLNWQSRWDCSTRTSTVSYGLPSSCFWSGPMRREPFHRNASPVHHADGRGSAALDTDPRSSCKSLRYRPERYRDRRRKCSYPPERCAGEDV